MTARKPNSTRKRSNKQIQQDRADNLEAILRSPLVKSGERFSIATMADYLGVAHGSAAKYLDDLMEMSKLSRTVAKNNRNNGSTYEYSRKATGFISLKIRKHTDYELGIR